MDFAEFLGKNRVVFFSPLPQGGRTRRRGRGGWGGTIPWRRPRLCGITSASFACGSWLSGTQLAFSLQTLQLGELGRHKRLRIPTPMSGAPCLPDGAERSPKLQKCSGSGRLPGIQMRQETSRRPEVTLVIPSENRKDPSDLNEHIDRQSPCSMLADDSNFSAPLTAEKSHRPQVSILSHRALSRSGQ